MNITIFTIGTRGDVQPYVALGLGLKAAGHKVTIGAPGNFEAFVTQYGLQFRAIGSDFEQVIKSDAFETVFEKERGLISFLRSVKQIKREIADYHMKAYEQMWQAAQDADLLILQLLVLPAADFAQKLNIPVIYAGLQPSTPTGDFPLIGTPDLNLGRWFNRSTYLYLARLNLIPRKTYNKMRKQLLGYAPRPYFAMAHKRKGKVIPTLYGFSRHLVSRPKEWPKQVKICGFWFIKDKDWQPDDALQSFLCAGAPPIFIGFSSLTWKAEDNTRLVVEAVKKWGGRAVIAKGWGGIDPERFYDKLPDTIYVIESAPHSKLFPLMSAIIHHGGAGSTGAALAAGKPSLICPDMVDQPFWAKQVHQLGVGPKPVPLSKLTADILAEKISELTKQEHFHTEAIKIADKLSQEDGVANAVQAIHTVCTEFLDQTHSQKQ